MTYAAKIEKGEAPLDWRLSAVQLARQVRAFNPFPGALGSYQGTPIKVWSARVGEAAGRPGSVLSVGKNGIVVACGEGSLWSARTAESGAGSVRLRPQGAGRPELPQRPAHGTCSTASRPSPAPRPHPAARDQRTADDEAAG